MHKIVLYGEDHTKEYRKIINDDIILRNKQTPFDYLVLEELGPHSYFTQKEKVKAIKNQMWSVGPMGLQLAIELDIPAIGMDLWNDDTYKDDVFDDEDFAIDITRSFMLREKQMLEKITKYYAKGNVAVIVGDSHLRTVKTTQLGDVSPIYLHFKNDANATIVRCPHKEID